MYLAVSCPHRPFFRGLPLLLSRMAWLHPMRSLCSSERLRIAKDGQNRILLEAIRAGGSGGWESK